MYLTYRYDRDFCATWKPALAKINAEQKLENKHSIIANINTY